MEGEADNGGWKRWKLGVVFPPLPNGGNKGIRRQWRIVALGWSCRKVKWARLEDSKC